LKSAATAMPHIIRLRGPWRWELLSAESHVASASSGEIDPSDAASKPEAGGGSLRLTRRFGRPTLAGGEKVVLAAHSSRAIQSLRFNNVPLTLEAAALQVRVDITERLAWRNELIIDLARSPPDEILASTPLLEAWLEIEAQASSP
jgi:hypothetical protein